MIVSLVLVLTALPGPENQKSVHVLENSMEVHLFRSDFSTLIYIRKINGNYIIFLAAIWNPQYSLSVIKTQ